MKENNTNIEELADKMMEFIPSRPINYSNADDPTGYKWARNIAIDCAKVATNVETSNPPNLQDKIIMAAYNKKGVREKFESWAKGNKWFYSSDTKDGYVDGVTNVAFLAYQAASVDSKAVEVLERKIADAEQYIKSDNSYLYSEYCFYRARLKAILAEIKGRV